jgi:hypothetical protein
VALRSFSAGGGPEAREVSIAAAALFVVTLAYAFVQVAAPPALARALRPPPVGADFAEFYVAGEILNRYGADSLYDLDLQKRLFHSMDARNRNAELWYAGPPHLALLFRPFALLPYRAAYVAWMAVVVLFFAIGIRALWPYLADLPGPYRRAAVLLSLSFAPFATWSLIGGQIGVIAFAVVAWCIHFDLAGKYVTAGAILALCSYKPTLLLLFGAFLLIRMNLRLLLGFGAGLSGILAIIVLTTGTKALAGWIALLSTYGRFVSNGNTPWPAAWPQLIDLNHFMRRVAGAGNHLSAIPAAAVFVAVAAILIRHWREFDKATAQRRRLVWAVTITASSLTNMYLMIYDSTFLIAGTLLTAAVIYQLGAKDRLSGRFHAIVALVFFSAMIPLPAIVFLRVHVYTLAIAALAVFQYRLFSRLPADVTGNQAVPCAVVQTGSS